MVRFATSAKANPSTCGFVIAAIARRQRHRRSTPEHFTIRGPSRYPARPAAFRRLAIWSAFSARNAARGCSRGAVTARRQASHLRHSTTATRLRRPSISGSRKRFRGFGLTTVCRNIRKGHLPRALSVLIESEPRLQNLVLTRFRPQISLRNLRKLDCYANRSSFRSKTLWPDHSTPVPADVIASTGINPESLL